MRFGLFARLCLCASRLSLESRAHETCEKRVGRGGPALELRMKLTPDEERVIT